MDKVFKNILKEDLDKVAKLIQQETDKFFKRERRACVIFLIGDLGSGKTTFTKSLAKTLDIQEEIISPTFVLRKDYPNLIHIDGYRFEKGEEGRVLELFRELEKDKLIIVIEWPERFVEAIDLKPDFVISFEVINTDERNISFKAS